MKLGKLLENVKVLRKSCDLETKIESITNDHRKVKDGYIFVALKGNKRDGNNYIEEAIENGAVVIVTDKYQKLLKKTQYVIVQETRAAISQMWSNYYDNPSKGIKTVAITGTNGKTSTAYFLYNILKESKVKCGLISTIECIADGEIINTKNKGAVSDIVAAMTTPDPEILNFIYNKMKEKNVEIVVMEASSHALEQKRLEGVEIDIGCFTNLSSEHLDYHKTVENYKNAKEKLIRKSKISVINIDDTFGKNLKEKYKGVSFGCSAKGNADFSVQNVQYDLNGCKYEILSENGAFEICVPIIGTYTVYNSMLAIACAVLLGIEKEHIIKGIWKTKSIKGRMERYKDKLIFIDYAHTPDALEKVITSIRIIDKDKKIISMFGCGGDRDKSKRAEMGKVSSKLSDITVVTSDNSRSEQGNKIIADIISGIEESKKYYVIPNRKEAIMFLAKNLKNDEILLLLGKGHESYEITREGMNHFSEIEILDEVFSHDI